MEIVKKTFFASLGIIFLIMFVSYGITIIFGANATYITSQNYTTSYGFQFIMYRWDYIAWSNNLSDTTIWDSIILQLDPEHLARTWQIVKQVPKPENGWQVALQPLMYLAYFMIALLNTIITALNWILLLPIHALQNILQYAFVLLGINMTNGSWWLATAFNWFNHNFWIPWIIL